MESTLTPPIAPKPAQKPDLREIIHSLCVLVIAVGFLIMALRDTLADVLHARTGVAILTAIALVVFYLTEKKRE